MEGSEVVKWGSMAWKWMTFVLLFRARRLEYSIYIVLAVMLHLQYAI